MLDEALTARIAAAKRRLLDGGLLQLVSWGVPVGERDERGHSDLDAFIEERPALDPGRVSTERADNTVLIILDPLAITDSHFFRWGEPSHTYSVKQVDGILQDAESGTRYFSEVSVIR